VQFDVMAVATGVCRLGGGEEWKPAPPARCVFIT
jgi:hypothetical protein